MLPLLAGLGIFLSGAMNGAASFLGASAQEKAAKANADSADEDADIADWNARIVTEQAASDAGKIRVMGRKTIGNITASVGASGLQADGNAVDIIAESAANSEQDALNIKTAAGYQAQAFGIEAKRKRKYADLLRSGADSTMLGGYLSAGGNVLGGLANAVSKLPTGSASVRRTG